MSRFPSGLTSAAIFGSSLAAGLAGKLAQRAKGRRPTVAVAGAAGLVALGYAATFANTLAVPRTA